MSYYRYTKREEHYTGRDRKLWELENDIEDGLLVKLPCKVGDKVYMIIEKPPYANLTYFFEDIDCNTIIEEEVEGYEIFYPNNKTEISIFTGHGYLTQDNYNVTWFTDKELAEKKLEELKNV